MEEPAGKMTSERIRVRLVGVGNEYRGDDAAGLIVAREIRRRDIPGLEVWEAGGGTEITEQIDGAEAVIIVDAVVSGAEAGTLVRFDAAAGRLPGFFVNCSTHAISVADGVELARVLGKLPRRCIVYGIEGREFEPCLPLSGEVKRAAEEAAELIEREIRAMSAM